MRAADLTVVIPTRDRWPVLGRTLGGLSAQSSRGFETVVVVDGTDQTVPALPGDPVVVVQPHGGPGAARNAGAARTRRPLVLFLGDDMVPHPDLVARHLDAHRRHPADEVAVLGRADWHPQVAGGRLAGFIDRAGAQFDYPPGPTDDAGFGRFYSCNLSLKRRFFVDTGGFDEAFTYYYEDLDCGWRLAQKGMRLVYEPAARSAHLHRYDLAGLERRYAGVAAGEHLMARRHAWFEPFFLPAMAEAVARPTPSALWPRLVGRVPPALGPLRRRAELRADDWVAHRLAPAFLGAWAAADDLADLQDYLGDAYDPRRLEAHAQAVDAERAAATDEEAFYRTSQSYLYDLTVFAMSGTKAPYHAEIRALLPDGGRLLDYGCGIGADGLRLLQAGYQVAFCDYANPSTDFLRWRLHRRGVEAPVFDLGAGRVPGGFDLAYSFDVIEHVDDPFAFLAGLEARASLVAVNLLEEEEGDTDLHRPLPVGAILDHAAAQGLISYRRYHGRSHLVVYRSRRHPAGSVPLPARWRSQLERRTGARRPGRAPWFPVPTR